MEVNYKYLYNELNNDCLNPFHGFRCRSCSNCLSANTKLWTQRLLSEFVGSDEMIAFCLTYTDSMLRSPEVGASPYKEDEIVLENMFENFNYSLKYDDWYEPCLSKRDCQLFIKRLRERIGNKSTIKYFLKGEYGGDKGRPHIHGIIFYHNSSSQYGLYAKKDDIMKSWYNGMYKEYKQPIYLSHIMNVGKRIRVNPIIEFGTIDLKTLAYICKYTSKEVIKDKFPSSTIVPEFTLKSRHIGNGLFAKQLEEKQKQSLPLFQHFFYNRYVDNYDAFERLFLQVFTFHNPQKQCDVFMPKYLYSQFFNGYYVYPVHQFTKEYDELMEKWKKGEIEKDTINERRLFSKEKFWHTIDENKINGIGQFQYDEFCVMKEKIIQHNIHNLFNRNIVEEGEKGLMTNEIINTIIKHRKEVETKEKNRRSGAYKYRQSRYDVINETFKI